MLDTSVASQAAITTKSGQVSRIWDELISFGLERASMFCPWRKPADSRELWFNGPEILSYPSHLRSEGVPQRLKLQSSQQRCISDALA